jgi:hypothetical protein
MHGRQAGRLERDDTGALRQMTAIQDYIGRPSLLESVSPYMFASFFRKQKRLNSPKYRLDGAESILLPI